MSELTPGCSVCGCGCVGPILPAIPPCACIDCVGPPNICASCHRPVKYSDGVWIHSEPGYRPRHPGWPAHVLKAKAKPNRLVPEVEAEDIMADFRERCRVAGEARDTVSILWAGGQATGQIDSLIAQGYVECAIRDPTGRGQYRLTLKGEAFAMVIEDDKRRGV